MWSFFTRMFERFHSDRRGNVAMMFGVAVVPMMAMAGGVVDYTVALQVREQVQSAVDGTALSLAHDAGQMTATQVQTAAADRFTGYYYQGGARGLKPAVTATVSGNTLTVKAQTSLRTSFLGMIGIDAWPVGASATSVFKSNTDQTEIALVLDNTGSMKDNNKMVELKHAVNNFIDKLEKQSGRTGTVKLSIVPFNTQVQIGKAYRTASWLTFGAPVVNPDLRASGVVVATTRNWTGCVTDRDQPYDTLASGPLPGSSSYVASACVYAGLSAMMPLTSQLEEVRATVNAMRPTGATNITVGLTMGLATLRSDSPFGTAASTRPGVAKFVILLTDGNNTQNRWDGNGQDGNADISRIDDRLREACREARAHEAVRVFTIRVIDGNAGLLRDCATDPSYYTGVTDASQLQPVFERILNTINGIRLAS